MCSAMVIEGTITAVAEQVTKSVSVPTIGIGAGAHCDGQVLVSNDMLGLVHMVHAQAREALREPGRGDAQGVCRVQARGRIRRVSRGRAEFRDRGLLRIRADDTEGRRTQDHGHENENDRAENERGPETLAFFSPPEIDENPPRLGETRDRSPNMSRSPSFSIPCNMQSYWDLVAHTRRESPNTLALDEIVFHVAEFRLTGPLEIVEAGAGIRLT